MEPLQRVRFSSRFSSSEINLILYLHKSRNTALLPLKNLHRRCFRFVLGHLHVPGEIESNDCICASREYSNSHISSQLRPMVFSCTGQKVKWKIVVPSSLSLLSFGIQLCRGMPLIRCKQISISVTKCPVVLFPNFNITRVSEYMQNVTKCLPNASPQVFYKHLHLP